MDTITPKDNPDEFKQLCEEQNITYLSTVHHFKRDALGIYQPVFWGEIAQAALDRRKNHA